MLEKSALEHLFLKVLVEKFLGDSDWPSLGHVPTRASLVAQTVKNPPAMRETWVQSLGCEDPLEKEMATHSSILAWKISWTEEPGGLQSMGSTQKCLQECS